VTAEPIQSEKSEARRDLYRLLMAVAVTVCGVMLVLGIAWLQFQVATIGAIQAQRGERIIAVETQLGFLRAEIADLRVRQQELERAVARVRAGR
jgi:hypothetical protein